MRLARLSAAVLALVGCVAVEACTRLIVVPAPGKSHQDFATDRYDCVKESSHSGWEFNRWGGGGGQQLNEDQYFMCMEARGHRVVRQNKLTGSVAEP